MLLLICASLQPQATPSWLPGSLHEPRSQATSSDMRNLAHQPRRFCLVLGLAPLRLLLLVPVSVLFGSSSPETLKFEEGGGRPNYKMCWWSAKRKAKFCYFAVLSNDSNSLSTCTLQTQYTSLIRSTIRFEQFTNVCFHCHCNCHPFKEKNVTPAHHQSHILKTYVLCLQCQISNSFWGAGGWTLFTVLKTSDPKHAYPYYSHTHLSFFLRSHTKWQKKSNS